jgi:hypothetical protein
MVSALVLLSCAAARSQTVPADWKIIKDAKATCQIAVPPDWVPFGESNGAAIFHDSTTAIAVVTHQAGQDFKPLTPALVRSLGIAKEHMFENTATRLFYQDRVSRNPEETNAYSSSVPRKGGTCSCHVVVLPSIAADVAKKVAMSLSPVPET